jgi:hypothetical protein
MRLVAMGGGALHDDTHVHTVFTCRIWSEVWPDWASASPAVPGRARQAIGIGLLMTIVVIGCAAAPILAGKDSQISAARRIFT